MMRQLSANKSYGVLLLYRASAYAMRTLRTCLDEEP